MARAAVDGSVVERAEAAERRHTERRPFLVEPVPEEAIRSLLAVAADAGVYAYAVQRADEQLDLAVVFSWADGVELADPAYRAELAHWTRAADAPDGVPAAAVPHVPAGAPRHTDVPVRDFEAGITGGQELVQDWSTSGRSTSSCSAPPTTGRRGCGPARRTPASRSRPSGSGWPARR